LNLKTRLSLLAVVLILASAVSVWISVQTLAERIITEWALRYVEKQVLYDKERVLQSLLREIVLARQMASSPVLIEWLESPDDMLAEAQGLMELERYRESFTYGNYFLGVRRNGNYYYNNAENEFAGDQMRYRLSPSEPADRWFYGLVGQDRDLYLNVNPNTHLGITRLWISVLLRNGEGEVLGVAGTGLNLSGFLNDIVDSGEEGITSLFLNYQGSIQLYRDQSMIDFSGTAGDQSEQSNLRRMMSVHDFSQLEQAMALVKETPGEVVSRFVTIDGTRYLAGVAYLPEIEWYEITLMDLHRLLPLSRFNSILMVFGISLLVAVLIFNLVLQKVVLAPLLALDQAIRRFRRGEYRGEPINVRACSEIGHLVEEFEAMTREVYEVRSHLEQKVQERTEALNQLSLTDPLTGLLNRRGMEQRLREELQRSARENRPLGIIWIDLDRFKDINDVYGHAVGDEALVVVSTVLRSVLREYDAASRWGGDEFLVMIRDTDQQMIEKICERLLRVIRGQIVKTPCGASLHMTFSIGACLTCDEDHDEGLSRADMALYAAKDAGRNRYRLYTEELRNESSQESGPPTNIRSADER